MNIDKCLHCGYEIERHESLDGERNPSEGDISFCIDCAKLHIFTKEGFKKIDINMLDEDTKEKIKVIETAWLKTRALAKINKLENKKNEKVGM